jgi:hypothetical protein
LTFEVNLWHFAGVDHGGAAVDGLPTVIKEDGMPIRSEPALG